MVPMLFPSIPYTVVPSTLSLPIKDVVSFSIVAIEFLRCPAPYTDNVLYEHGVPNFREPRSASRISR
jgi:hypothetical protein